MSPRARNTLLALVSGASFLLLCAGAELVARGASHASPRQAAQAEFVARSLAYLEPCHRRRWTLDGERLVATADERGPRPGRPLPRARQPGVARLAIVGESSAHLMGLALQALLERSPCGRRFELLQCALPGSGLEHTERRFDEVMAESPDVVLVTFGHNLRFVFPTDERRLRARHLRDRSRLLTLLGAPFDGPPGSSNAPLEQRLPLLERFLRRAARTARARRVGLVVSTMAPNLWMPPQSRPEDRDGPALLDARYREAAEGPAAAAHSLDPSPPGATPWRDFVHGALLARAGDPAAARTHLQRALARDASATRVMPGVNDAIRRLALEERFTVRDAERAVEQRAPQSLPGWESFSDNCHLSSDAFAREADAVFEAARPWLSLPPSCAVPPGHGFLHAPGSRLRAFFGQASPSDPSWTTAAALLIERRSLAEPTSVAPEVEGYLGAQPSPPPAALEALAEGLWRAGRRDEAARLNERACDAGSAAAWVQRGEFALRRGDVAAARSSLERALSLDPARADARGLLARLAAAPPTPAEAPR